jgi:hypothetical protein
MYQVKVKGIRKSRLVCDRCGSEDVVIHAECRWNFDKQRWEFSEFMDGMDDYCIDCGCETCVEERFEYVNPDE